MTSLQFHHYLFPEDYCNIFEISPIFALFTPISPPTYIGHWCGGAGDVSRAAGSVSVSSFFSKAVGLHYLIPFLLPHALDIRVVGPEPSPKPCRFRLYSRCLALFTPIFPPTYIGRWGCKAGT